MPPGGPPPPPGGHIPFFAKERFIVNRRHAPYPIQSNPRPSKPTGIEAMEHLNNNIPKIAKSKDKKI